VQGESEANKARHHLPDGPAQQTRDAEMARDGTDFSAEAVAWLYGHDAGRQEAIYVGSSASWLPTPRYGDRRETSLEELGWDRGRSVTRPGERSGM
jgi:hypothetical protein